MNQELYNKLLELSRQLAACLDQGNMSEGISTAEKIRDLLTEHNAR